MKIGNNADQAAAAAEALRKAADTGKAKSGAAADSSPLVTVTESTKVELSAGASTAMSTSGQDGVFDADKVARMQEAIANGTYVISPEGIASKLIANARELLQNVGGGSQAGRG
jgi:negative regulator of flagellin synthesis FlgM